MGMWVFRDNCMQCYISSGHLYTTRNTAVHEGIYKNIYSFIGYTKQWGKNLNILLRNKDKAEMNHRYL